MWDEVLGEYADMLTDDYEARGIDDDSGFGPDGYFVHVRQKDH